MRPHVEVVAACSHGQGQGQGHGGHEEGGGGGAASLVLRMHGNADPGVDKEFGTGAVKVTPAPLNY